MSSKFNFSSKYIEKYRKKYALFQSLLKERTLMQSKISLQEQKELESQIETAFTSVLAALEEDPLNEFSNVGYFRYNFAYHTGMKEQPNIAHIVGLYENIKIAQFGIMLNEMSDEGILTEHLNKIFSFIKNRPFPQSKLRALQKLVENLSTDLFEPNDSILREMIEMGFKETEQSVYRSVQLSFLINILSTISMKESYSSRLKSLISLILKDMETERRYEWNVLAFSSLISAIKRTNFIDYFFPQLKKLFLKQLEEFEGLPYMFFDSEVFDSFLIAIEDTKFFELFKEWDSK